MGSRTRVVVVLAAWVVSAATLALAGTPKGHKPDPPNGPQVTVVNPPASPVPVAVQGPVQVQGEVVAQVVPPPAPAPYWVDQHLTLPDSITSIQGPLEIVPPGTRVVLQYVSFYCTTRPGDTMLSVGISVWGLSPDGSAKDMHYRFPLQKAAADFGGLSRWHASHAVQLYADPGQIRYEAVRTGEGDFWACDVALSGQSVLLP